MPDSILLNGYDYSVHRVDRSNKIGGGTCIIHRNFLKTRFIPVVLHISDVQMLCVDFLGSPTKCRVIVCYTPPSLNENSIVNFLNFFESSQFWHCVASIIVCGDFNIPSNRRFTKFLDIMTETGFIQYIKSPTRDNNILDLVFVNDVFAVSSLTVDVPFSTSDHNSINFNIVFLSQISIVSGIPKYRFNDENLKLISDDLCLADWASVFNTGDLETDWYNFTNIIFTSVNKFADKITPGPSRPRRSYPSAVNKLLSKKTHTLESLQNFQTDPLKNKYLECARMCRLAIFKCVADKENYIVCSNKVDNFYSYANKKLSCWSGIGVIRNSDGNLISDPVDLANCFNDCFASVFVKDYDVTPHSDSLVPGRVSLNNITFSRTDVFKILKGLNARSAGGPDHIPPILLKKILLSPSPNLWHQSSNYFIKILFYPIFGNKVMSNQLLNFF